MNSVYYSVCIATVAALASSSLARPQYDLKAIHPVAGTVEAVGSGQYGRSLIRFALPYAMPPAPCVTVGIGFTAGDGILEAVFFRADGSQAGMPQPIRVRDLRTVGQDQGMGDLGNTVTGFGNSNRGQLLQLDAAPYIAAAGPDAHLVQIRSVVASTCAFACGIGGPCQPGAFVSLNDAPDGVAGSQDQSDTLDQRFQIVRDRGSLNAAEIIYDNSTWLTELRLTFVQPLVGPALQASPVLRSVPVLWAGPQGEDPTLVENPNDTDPADLSGADFEVFGLPPVGAAWQTLSEADTSSVSCAPGTNVLSIWFDRKTSRLWNNGLGYSIRCASNSNIRDSFGNRLRSNSLSVQFISCPTAPGPFQTLSPEPNGQAVPPSTTLTWADSSCRASYALRIATDPDMTNAIVTGGTTGTSYSLAATPLNLNTRYYWQVTATNVNGQTTNLGGVQTFRTLIPGDLNADGVVNVADLTAFLGNFGVTVP